MMKINGAWENNSNITILVDNRIGIFDRSGNFVAEISSVEVDKSWMDKYCKKLSFDNLPQSIRSVLA